MLTDDTEEEDVKREYIEETNRDAVMICAAKLVATDVVPLVAIFLFILLECCWYHMIYNGNLYNNGYTVHSFWIVCIIICC